MPTRSSTRHRASFGAGPASATRLPTPRSAEDLSHRLRHLDVPTLLLWGDADPLSPVAVGQKLAELLPRSKLVVIPGGTHDLVLERASEIAPHVAAHLA